MSKYSINLVYASLTAGFVTFLVYLRALGCDFVNLDDPLFVINNQAIRGLDRNLLVWAFSLPKFDLWIPLTWISLAIDYHFWQLNPLGYHLTNILLHAANSALVVLIAERIYRKVIAEGLTSVPQYLQLGLFLLAGLLFGIHPLRVESVAWVTERKDVLNGLFSLAAIYCYLRYADDKDSATATSGWNRNYLAALFFFAMSLLAKSISVVIPALLLLLDWYPFDRFRQGRSKSVLLEKIPYLLLSLAISAITITVAAQNQLLVPFTQLTFSQRIIISGNAIFEYVRLLLMPTGILPFNVIPDAIPIAFVVKSAIVLLVTLSALYARRRWQGITAVWFCFLLPLLPVLAIVQNGDQAFAARYTYLPSVSISIAAAGLVFSVYIKLAVTKIKNLSALLLLPLLVLIFYTVMTIRLIDVWQNTATFWSRVIEKQPLVRAYSDRGVYYLIKGESSAALDDFSKALEIAANKRMTLIYNLYAFRGVALADLGRYAESSREFDRAIAILPHPTYYYYRGLAKEALGQRREAAADFAQAGPAPPPIDWF